MECTSCKQLEGISQTSFKLICRKIIISIIYPDFLKLCAATATMHVTLPFIVFFALHFHGFHCRGARKPEK